MGLGMITEQFVRGKMHDRLLCEDEIVVTKDFVAVVDGSTSKGTVRYTEKSTGRTAADIVSFALKELVPADTDMASAVSIVSEAIHGFYLQLDVLGMVSDNPENRLTASAVIYSCCREEVWMVGDCQCMLDGILYANPKRIDALLAEVRSLYCRLADGKMDGRTWDGVDKGREYILPLLRRQCHLQNAAVEDEYAYGVFDGIGSPLPFCKLIHCRGAHEIVLASDGYPELCASLDESERRLEELMKSDPMCIGEFKSTKGMMPGQCSFDDRAYVKMVFPVE